MNFTRLLTALFLLLSFYSFSQEVEKPLPNNTQAAINSFLEREFPGRNRGGGSSLELPFFDDFSRYSLPTNNPAVPESWQMWSDNSAYINCTFPVSPLTLGVATLDGLDADGTPYADTLYFPTISESFLDWGLSDSLTSMPLDLSGYTPDDSVYLVFSFQGGGLGNAPDADGILGAEGDSLILEFYSPLQQGQWFRAWATEGGLDPNIFQTVFIPISELIYLQDGFRFRFKNYCTLHGALDHWNLDYVIVNNNIESTNFSIDEVGFQYCNNTLLNFGYTAMPWTHFLTNPELYMNDVIDIYQRNLGPSENISTTWDVSYEGDIVYSSAMIDAHTASNGYSSFTRTLPLEDYVYAAPDALDSASFEYCAHFNPTDIHTQNDTMCFTQTFSNYYAYDDGTAERAYGLQNAGGKVAMRFNTPVSDTLLGVYIYFVPVQYMANDQTFILQVWDDVSGEPGNLLTSEFDNFTFSAPHYYAGGPNLFYFYPLSDSAYVQSGDFYVGYIQQNDVSLNMGLDKNTSANATKLFYQLQGTTTWSQSGITGSVMIRPVFRSGLPDWVGLSESEVLQAELFPNPAHGNIQMLLRADYEFYTCRVLDLTGRVVLEEKVVNNGNIQLDISSLEAAPYIFQMNSNKTGGSFTRHFIKQ